MAKRTMYDEGTVPALQPIPGLDFDPAYEAEAAEAGASQDELTALQDKVQAVVQRGVERAIQHFNNNVEPDLVKALDYYHGRPFGDEQEGRSKVVSTDVGDATRMQLPSLMRIFFGSHRAVQYIGRGPEDEALARQMTDYVNYVIKQDNPGFLTFYNVWKDALALRVGIVKWWWEKAYRVEAAEYTGLDEDAVSILLDDEEVSDIEVLSEGTETIEGVERPVYDLRVTRICTQGKARIDGVPPEEFVYAPMARDIESAPLIAHVRQVPADELLQMGIEPELVEEARGKNKPFEADGLTAARFQYNYTWDPALDADVVDETQETVTFAEVWTLVDGDEDDIAELRLFKCVGPDFKIANGAGLGEVVDEIPFAIYTPEPEPHALVGLGNYDLLKDVQRVKSHILRGTLDSLAQALEPRTEVVVGEVYTQDLVSPEINGIVRVNKPGMMREINHTFVGGDTLPVLEYYDEVKESRTGITKASAGLDADSLQSSTKAAVAATLSAAQQRIEVIARIFAETGHKRLFTGLLKLLVSHQDHSRVVRLRNEWVTVDPRRWNASMDVEVNVGLGQGSSEEQIALLGTILTVQQQLMQTGSPLVTNVELRNTLARAVELAGYNNPAEFFRPWTTEDEKQAQEAAAQQPPPPDPNTMLVQIEAQKAQAMVQIEQAKLQAQMQAEQAKMELERWKVQMEDDRERDRVAREFALKQYELELKYSGDINDQQLRAQVEQDRADMDAAVRQHQTLVQAAVQHDQAAMQAQAQVDAAEVQAEAQREVGKAKAQSQGGEK